MTDKPIPGKKVILYTGTKVLDNAKNGDNFPVGANAFIIKNVHENCVEVSVPTYIVRGDDAKVREPLWQFDQKVKFVENTNKNILIEKKQ